MPATIRAPPGEDPQVEDLVEERDPDGHRDDGDEVRHERRRRRPEVGDDAVAQDVGVARADHPEDDHGEDPVGRQVDALGGARGQRHGREEDGAHG
jgi:hypothetical protein